MTASTRSAYDSASPGAVQSIAPRPATGGAVPRSVDEDEPRLVVVVGSHGRVVGGAHVDRRVLDGRGAPAEHGVELGVVVVREEHRVVRQPWRAPAQCQQQHEPGERGSGAVQAGSGGGRRGSAQQRAVDGVGVGVGDDDVGRDGLARRQPDAGDPAGLDDDLRDVAAGAYRGASFQRPVVHGQCELAQAAAHVPRAERGLDVRDHRQRGGRQPRVGARVGGVAVEQHAQPRVAQIAGAEPTQALPRRDRAHVGDAAGQAQQLATALEG